MFLNIIQAFPNLQISFIHFPQYIHAKYFTQETFPRQDFVHEFLITYRALQVSIETGRQPSELWFRRVEAIFLHQPLQVISGQVSLSKAIDAGKCVVYVETGFSGASFFGNFDFLVNVEMGFEALEEGVSRLVREVVLLWHVWVV